MKIVQFLFLGVLCMFLSCDTIVECIVNKRPELPDTSFKVGNVNGYYYQELTAEIKNEPRDDNYSYNFDINGNLPDGLSVTTTNRTLVIEGMPSAPGTFNFTIYLYVEGPEYYDEESDKYKDGLCSKSTSKKYSIIIN
ncbi:Ig domain-containing protein [uncultured Gelidibacter sp.]|uniref:Ig domain-containing protein n=1 Tax=uncultured Gelidibacter sp. TaxID=259318 RepID=UPI00261A050B|nr:Ig domain-containing protein [uncultured Gelidibacter sp.]